MGYYGAENYTPKTIEAEKVSEHKAHGSYVTHRRVGNNLYIVAQSKKEESFGKKFMLVYHIEKHDGMYMYKPMDEYMGPHFYDCPLSLLEKLDAPFMESPEMNSWAENWRNKVREFHAKKAKVKTLKIGDVVSLVDCKIPQVEIRNLKPLRGSYNGITYRLKPSHIGEVISPTVS